MWKILKDITKKNKRQLFLTFLLVAMENLMAIFILFLQDLRLMQ